MCTPVNVTVRVAYTRSSPWAWRARRRQQRRRAAWRQQIRWPTACARVLLPVLLVGERSQMLEGGAELQRVAAVDVPLHDDVGQRRAHPQRARQLEFCLAA